MKKEPQPKPTFPDGDTACAGVLTKFRRVRQIDKRLFDIAKLSLAILSFGCRGLAEMCSGYRIDDLKRELPCFAVGDF